jgi:hypothetical protein
MISEEAADEAPAGWLGGLYLTACAALRQSTLERR